MSFKFHAAQRHHIPRQRYRVQNWPDYDRGLVRRGDIRAWLSEDAIIGWRAECRTTPGVQRRFSNLTIEMTFILGAVLRLHLRQTEGFVCSLAEMMRFDLAVPDHTKLARRRRTVDVRDHRRPYKGPVYSVINSTGLNSSAQASGREPSMARRDGPGASCTSRSIPRTMRSSLTS
jgi:Transposase DDE domain